MLQEKARDFANLPLQILDNFQTNNRWLEKFKVRHEIQQHVLCGESADVDIEAANAWKSRITQIIEGFYKKTYSMQTK